MRYVACANERGSSLLTVLVSLSLLAALLAISMSSITTTQTTITTGHRQQNLETSVLSLLLTGKEIALDQRRTRTSTARAITNVIVAKEPHLISVTDLGGLIDVNAADLELMRQFLDSLGLDAEAAISTLKARRRAGKRFNTP